MIEINNLNFQYRKSTRLFEGLNLDLPSGNIYGLLGKNGAGKSTLLKLISGLLFPGSGELRIVDHQPRNRYPSFLHEIFLISEEFHLPTMKISTYIDIYSSFYPRFNHEQFQAYINEFQLDQEEKLSSLSYGQKKKFLLSFGLATDCKLLILDEPTNGLDIPSKSQFRKIVASAIHEERGFIISTHQVRDMENLIDPIIILDEGEIVFFQDFESVTKKLRVSRETTQPDDSAIYYESTFSDHVVVRENTTGEETRMNLEILFNAVVNSKEKINNVFNK